MIKVLISRNYPFPDLERQTPGCKGIWNNIEFTEDSSEEVDFIVVFNQPSADIKTKAFEGARWLFLQEPPYTRNEYFKYHFRFADLVVSGFSEEIDHNEQAQAGLPWHINKNYDELLVLKADQAQKRDAVSWITSNNNMFPGHQPRLDFIDFLKNEKFDFDLFGRGFDPIDDKFDGIFPYKYSIAVENYFAPDYWTEKAVDCILSWTIPLYYGCTNMGDYFPKGSFVEIDIKQPQKALETIQQVMAEDYWSKNLDALAEARELILNKYQMFPMLEKRINKFMEQNPSVKKQQYFIPASGLTRTEEIKKKLRKIIGK
ncbi:MAG: glycosyltransferase family 10 [Flavobacteriales bacterium]|nr:glycosyltransferase family 10 [Flavobacteriales bacterium]